MLVCIKVSIKKCFFGISRMTEWQSHLKPILGHSVWKSLKMSHIKIKIDSVKPLQSFNFRAKNSKKNPKVDFWTFSKELVQFEGLKYQPWLYAFLMMIFKKPSWEVSNFLAVASLKNTYANIWARDFHFMLQLESGKR